MSGPRTGAAVFASIALATSAFTCGDLLPVVVNGLDRPIRVRTTWDDGRATDHDVAPGTRLFLSRPPRHLVEVVITPPSGEPLTMTRDDAPELLGGRVTGPLAGWKATPWGIQPLSLAELRSPGSVSAPGYALRSAMSLTPGRHGAAARLEILEDDRLGHATRAALAGDPDACDAEPPAAVLHALCAAIRQEPLRPAVLRLVEADDRARSTRPLERPLGELAIAHLYSSVRPTYLLTVDRGAGFGSYSGPLTRLVEVDGVTLRWLTATDVHTGAPVDLALSSSLKSAWRIVPRPDGRGSDILAVQCRPDFGASTLDDGRFVVTFMRYSFEDGRWRLHQRSEQGFWEADDDAPGSFPPPTRFP